MLEQVSTPNSEVAEQPKAKAPTLDIVKASFKADLAKIENIEDLIQRADKIQVNEENLDHIKQFLSKRKELEKALEKKKTEVKAPYLSSCNTIDLANREMLTLIGSIYNPVQKKYETVCKEVEAKRQKAEAEKKRLETIRTGIEQNYLAFVEKITKTDDLRALYSIENEINLHKGNKNKYAELLPEAKAKFETLTGLLNNKKDLLKKLAEAKSVQGQDQYEKLEAEEKVAGLQEQLQDANTNIQEKAVDHLINETPAVVEAEVILPTVKPKRTSWKWEIKDEDILKAYKKAPHLFDIVPNKEKIDEYLKNKRTEGIPEGQEEFVFAFIRFYLDKQY